MTESAKRALLAIGVYRYLNMKRKKQQEERAKKVAAYLKITKGLNSNVFKFQLRIDSQSLFKLLGLIRPHMESLNLNLEEVSIEERLLVTLKYLATGCPFEEASYSVKPHLLKRIIPETCNAIKTCLIEYLKFPKSTKEWEDIALSFEKKWQFSNCTGALVAKHILVDQPPDNPHKYLNHKNSHSIVMVGIVNANHEFIYIEVGSYGGYGFIYESTEFFDDLVTFDSLNLPENCPLKGSDSDTPMPYVFLGETEFLIENIMRPYPTDQITDEKRVFNYRFARAKRVADNAFGILYERFGLFHRNLSVDDDLNMIIMTCCCLHNFLTKNGRDYLNEESFDTEDLANMKFKPASWRLNKDYGTEWCDTHPLPSLRHNEEKICDDHGEMVRDRLKNYFNNEAKVPFQDQMINVVPGI